VLYCIIGRHIDQMGPENYRGAIAGKCFTYATACGGLRLLPYDATTLYFADEPEDDLRTVGCSKECHVHPQIVVGCWLIEPDSR
jgi:hypothetical protein